MNEHMTDTRGFGPYRYACCAVFACALFIAPVASQAQMMVPQSGGPGSEPKPEAAEEKPAAPIEKPAPVAAEPVAEGEEAVEELPIEERLRDPFWPVGHNPVRRTMTTKNGKPVKPVDIKPDWDTAEKQLNISGLVIDQSRKQEPFAIVNGNVVTVGDGLTLESLKFIYSWTVKDITKKEGLQLTRKRAALKDK